MRHVGKRLLSNPGATVSVIYFEIFLLNFLILLNQNYNLG